MSVQINPFLRNSLVLDAVVSGAAAFLMVAGSSLLAPLLGLPSQLLFWAGAVLVPFVALLVIVSRRPFASRLVLIDIIAINALWVAASLVLLVSGWVEPTMLGTLFVVAQAAAVGGFAVLQAVGLGRSAGAATA